VPQQAPWICQHTSLVKQFSSGPLLIHLLARTQTNWVEKTNSQGSISVFNLQQHRQIPKFEEEASSVTMPTNEP
jgi:hypothetical protein